MFEQFFQKYKLTLNKGGMRSITKVELIMLIVLVISSLSILYYSILKIYFLGFFVSSGIIVIDTIVMLMYEKRKQFQNIDSEIAIYKEHVIENLIILLKHEQFNLYSLDGLDWMIKCCQEHIDNKKETKSLISTAAFPVFTMAYGVAINSMSTKEIALITTAFIILIMICNGVQREHNKKLNNGLPILHKVPPKRDYGRYFCILAEKGGTSHGGLTEKLSPFFYAQKQEVNAYGR